MPGLSRTIYYTFGVILHCSVRGILRSNQCMPQSSQNSISQSLRLFNKGRRFFGIRSTQSLHGDLQSHTNVPISPPTTSQKKFKKNNDVQHDIGVLAMTYILHDNSTIQELIHLIIKLHNCDDGKACRTCTLRCMPAEDHIFSSLRSLHRLPLSQSNSHPSMRKIPPER
jgi:hypothetical protein